MSVYINNKDVYLTRLEASKMLGISLSTLDRKIKVGIIKAYNFSSGRRIFIRKDDLFNSLICFNDAA